MKLPVPVRQNGNDGSHVGNDGNDSQSGTGNKAKAGQVGWWLYLVCETTHKEEEGTKMENRNRLSDAIVLMLIVMMWTGLIFVAIWLAFGWLVESFGREMAMVTTFALGGVVLAIVLWIASSRHTTSIWRSALHYAADTQEMSVTALRSLSSVQREDARSHRITTQAQAQIDVAAYRAQLGTMQDARRLALADLRSEQRTQPTQTQTWAMADEDDESGVQWVE